MNKSSGYILKIQKQLVRLITGRFRKYYLTGGTALTIYFNHRFSEDLDFFTQEYKKIDPGKIMKFIKDKTGFTYNLEAEQTSPNLVPMKVYILDISKGCYLKIDFVKDFHKNLMPVKSGLHSVDDIYYRKIAIGIGGGRQKDEVGRMVSFGRQTAKDLFDIYYLSKHRKPLAEFFLEHFSYDKAAFFINWYRTFNRMNLKIEFADLAPKVDVGLILAYLDKEILKNLVDKLI